MKTYIKPMAAQKLIITIHYEKLNDAARMLRRAKALVWNNVTCRNEECLGGNFSFTVENLDDIKKHEKFILPQELETESIEPRVEIINEKRCLIYVSRMDSFV